MAYDEELAARLREALDDRQDVTERKMFGGIAFMVRGHMCCGVIGDDLVLRLGEENAEWALDQPHTRVFDFSGRPAKGMVYVEPAATASEADLRAWVERGLAHVSSLPPKA